MLDIIIVKPYIVNNHFMISSKFNPRWQLVFMKRGGELIYAGPLGPRSYKLVDYLEVCYFLYYLSFFVNLLEHICII